MRSERFIKKRLGLWGANGPGERMRKVKANRPEEQTDYTKNIEISSKYERLQKSQSIKLLQLFFLGNFINRNSLNLKKQFQKIFVSKKCGDGSQK